MPSLLDLPTELLHELPQYYADLYSRFEAHLIGVHPDEYERVDALRALSQTSVRLRAVFLPVMWNHARAFFTTRNRRRKPLTWEKMVEDRMTALGRATYLHPYVRSLTVTMEECTVDNWRGMSEFLWVLAILPNLRNVRIIGLSPYSATLLSSSLIALSFPNITGLSAELTSSSIPALRAFPHLHTLDPGPGVSALDLYDSIAVMAPQLHTLNNIWLGTDPNVFSEHIRSIRHGFPQLQRLSLNGRVHVDALRALEHLPNLCYLALRYWLPGIWEQDVPSLEEIIAAATPEAFRGMT
ncbi:hypothetical protein C8F01DRAFT_1250169 [Mycena amicta]|nr:hypothetical protein C8F01DRAFT_1250169 [Mycena amicta]